MKNFFVLQHLEEHFSDIHLFHCGYANCDPLHSFGPAARPTYLIHLILDGKGTFQKGKEKFPLHKNQGFLIEPNELTFYQADKQDPWTYIWIGVNGEKCTQYLHEIGLNRQNFIFNFTHEKELEQIVMDMLHYKKQDLYDSFKLQGLLYSFLGSLSDSIPSTLSKSRTIENPYVKSAVTYIQSNYSEAINVSNVADFVSLNRSYLSTLFKNTIGMSVQEYIIDFRITRAAELLSLTDWPISRISESCGYQNSVVFSKAFKKLKKKTPSEYRDYDRKKVQKTLQSFESAN